MKASKRLFTGIPVPEQIKAAIYEKLVELQIREDHSIRWTPMENYHITLHFIGDTSPDQVAHIMTHLTKSLADTPKFKLDFTQYIFFPHRHPYMIWAKAEEHLAFDTLQKKIQSIFDQQPQSSKPAIPHITLARFKNPKIAKKTALPVLTSPLTIPVNAVVLWASTLTPRGAIYQEINSINLQY